MPGRGAAGFGPASRPAFDCCIGPRRGPATVPGATPLVCGSPPGRRPALRSPAGAAAPEPGLALGPLARAPPAMTPGRAPGGLAPAAGPGPAPGDDPPAGSRGAIDGIVDDTLGARDPGSASRSRCDGRGGASLPAAFAAPPMPLSAARGLSPFPGTRISPSSPVGTESPLRSAAAASRGIGRPVTGSVATRGLPVTGSFPELMMASVRARRIRPRAISASLASTFPSRLTSHCRINSSREAVGT